MPPVRKTLRGGILWLMGVPLALMVASLIIGLL